VLQILTTINVNNEETTMATTWELLETWDGTREESMPDPENEGETITNTLTDIKDIKVKFTCDDVTPTLEHERFVNVCLDANGAYDSDAMEIRLAEVANGVCNKAMVGAIS